MDLDLPELHARALAATARVVAGLGAEEWDVRVETAHTTVRKLVNHMVSENSQVAPVLAGESVDAVREHTKGDLLGDDGAAAFERSATSAAAAFRAPGALEASYPMGPAGAAMQGFDYCGNRFVDVLVHGWEIANVTGQDTQLDPELAESARVVIEPSIRALRENGVIAAQIEVPDGASSQTRLLAFFGFRG
jgi:uncharacterized protein (TIGR03086 family)